MADTDEAKLKKLEELLQSEELGTPSTKKILDMIEEADLSEDVKENLKVMLEGNVPKIFGHSSGGMLALTFAVIIFSIILFFGYKLYKSIKDKEKKREEKKKAKQMKKKK